VVIYLSQKADELTVREAADLLGVTSTTIYNLVTEGRLVPSREEKKIRYVRRYFRREDVERVRSSDEQ
jgi:DNA-binding transcriptional MerR regulator